MPNPLQTENASLESLSIAIERISYSTQIVSRTALPNISYVTLIEGEDPSWRQAMDERVTWTSGHGVVLLAVLAGFAFTSGFWDIFIALAPAAYLLVFSSHDEDNSPKTVVVSHLTRRFLSTI